MLKDRPFLRSIETRPEAKGRTDYPYGIPVLRNGDFRMEFPERVTFFVGENGSGKSTVMEAIAIGCGFNPSGGGRNNVYEFNATESPLADTLKLIWNFKMNRGFFLRAESFFNFSNYLENLKKELPDQDVFGPYGGESLHLYSHGESFMKLFQTRFTEGMFLLDEPEAALSPTRQLAFLARLHQLVRSGRTQFIIATHSSILLSYPGAVIYQFSGDGYRRVRYEETGHFTVTRDFLNAHESFLRHLLQENDE